MSVSVTDRGGRVSISDRQTEVVVSVSVTDRRRRARQKKTSSKDADSMAVSSGCALVVR